MNWKSYLNIDPTEWLLEEDNPSVKYFALLHIIRDEPKNHPEVQKAQEKIMQEGVVPKILYEQEPNGYWGLSENYYVRGKYKGTSWQLIILAELGADGKDDRIKKTCEFILENAQDPQTGAFSYLSCKNGGGDPKKILPCFTANMVWCLIRFGYLKDKRVQKAVEWLLKTQRFDDSIDEPPQGWPYERWEKCWGRHTCHSIIVKSLKAFSEIPKSERTTKIEEYIERGAEFMLKHHVYKRSHDLSRVGNEKWLNLGFPLMWDFDILEVLEILTRLGYKDDRMQDALDILVSKQDKDGRWKLERTFNGRFQVNIERKGKPSKWITLKALKVLKGYYG